MASLRRHHRTPFFVACFTGINGRRFQRSTKVVWDGKVESRRRAQRIADEYEDVARGLRTAQQVQNVMQDLFYRATGSDLVMPTARVFARDWLEDKRGSVEIRTHEFYRARIDSLLRHLGAKADASINMISERDIREWRDLEAKRVSAATVNLGLTVLRMFLGAAAKRNLAGSNMAARVPPLKKPSGSRRRPFTLGELRQLLPVLPSEWRSLVLFGLYTGQRLGDLARLRWSDIDPVAGEIRILSRKTDRAQKIPLAAPLRNFVRELPRPDRTDDPVHPLAFMTVEAGKYGNVSALSRRFHELLVDAGLVPKREYIRGAVKRDHTRNFSSLTFHALRHTLTSMLKNAGVSSAIAEEIVGHQSSEMNRIYTHIDTASLASAMELLPSIE